MVPSPFDPHPDHRAACRVASRAIPAAGPGDATVWIYEVEPSLPMNALVRIDGEADVKARALAAHASQNHDDCLVRAGMGLSACRALYSPPFWRNAEAFRVSSAALFLDFCRAVEEGSP